MGLTSSKKLRKLSKRDNFKTKKPYCQRQFKTAALGSPVVSWEVNL
jgi:hypothetical protein